MPDSNATTHTVSIELILRIKHRTVLSRTVLFSAYNPLRTHKRTPNLPEVITVHEIVTELEKQFLSTLSEGIPADCLDVFSSRGVFNRGRLTSVPEAGIKLNGKTAIYHFFITFKMHI